MSGVSDEIDVGDKLIECLKKYGVNRVAVYWETNEEGKLEIQLIVPRR